MIKYDKDGNPVKYPKPKGEPYRIQYDEEGNPKTIEVSSKNNIGIADITLGYDPPDEGDVTNYTKFNFKTN